MSHKSQVLEKHGTYFQTELPHAELQVSLNSSDAAVKKTSVLIFPAVCLPADERISD